MSQHRAEVSPKLEETSKSVLGRLAELQYGPTDKVLLFTQSPIGLGGQIARRLVGLRLALMTGRKVVFPSFSEFPYGQVFEPLHSEVDYEDLKLYAAPWSGGADGSAIVLADFWRIWNDPKLRDHVYGYIQPDLVVGRPDMYLDGLLLDFCKLTPSNQRYVEDAKRRLGVDEGSIGVHVRRGDKSVETPYVPVEVINAAISELMVEHGSKHIFACSDDVRVFDQLIPHAGSKVYFDAYEARYNNANHRLLMANPDLADQETKTAIKNIYLLGDCCAVVGQDNAHFAKLAASMIYYRSKGRRFGALIPGDYVRRASRLRGIVHELSGIPRRIIKKLLPSLTIRHLGR